MRQGSLMLAAAAMTLAAARPALAGAADDRGAIINLIARYGEVHDFGSPEEYADQFTGDAEIVVAGRVLAKGRDALVAQARRDHERFAIALPDGTKTSLMRHLISNAVVEMLDRNRASASSYVTTIVRDGEEGPKILSVGRYLDTLERVGGQWKIARRTITLDFGNAELGRKLGFSK